MRSPLMDCKSIILPNKETGFKLVTLLRIWDSIYSLCKFSLYPVYHSSFLSSDFITLFTDAWYETHYVLSWVFFFLLASSFNILYAFYLPCRHMIKKKSKEAFIAFKEALKFKYSLFPFSWIWFHVSQCQHMLAYIINFDYYCWVINKFG